MEKLNKKDIFERVAISENLSRKDAKAAVEKTFELIEEALLKNVEVNITNFGVFTPKKRAVRKGTHPKTHDILMLKGGKIVVFRTSKSLKEKLNK